MPYTSVESLFNIQFYFNFCVKINVDIFKGVLYVKN